VDVEMKKMIIALSICTLVAFSMMTIPIVNAQPTIDLPAGDYDIRMKAVYGIQDYFDITLSNVPDGYDLANGVYPGWCVQKAIAMVLNVDHSIYLYSSLSDSLPADFQEMPWDKINYIINHKNGASRTSIQNAIWCYTDNESCENDSVALALYNAAYNYSGPYIPQVGDVVALPIKGWQRIQLTFLELVIPPPKTLEGFVWYDSNSNGIQNTGEPAKSAVTVRLYTSDNTLINTTSTNSLGLYSFRGVEPGNYSLQFILPSGHKFSPKDAGTDDTIDSDADTTTGKTIPFNITDSNDTITIWDAGMYIESSGGTVTPPVEPSVPNKRPTADATVGEQPYQGFVNETITFNGSLSYDLDGRIISWHWNFGDGANGTGEVTTHVYTLPGNYNVSLLVRDDDFDTNIDFTTALITTGNNQPETPSLVGPVSGHKTVSYEYTIVATDPDGDSLQYIIDWGDETQFMSPSTASGTSVQTTHQWTAPGFYIVQAYAQDPFDNVSDIVQMTVAIDVRYVGSLGYLIDGDGDGIFDTFHNNATGVETSLSQQSNGNYLIDTDGDGVFNTEYDPASGQTQEYSEQPWLQYGIIFLVALIIICVIVYFFVRSRSRSRTINKNSEDKKP
jgi:hypothetical protein